MPLKFVRQDIVKMNTDAVVNAANTELLMGAGVCGAIFRAAGAKELADACASLSPISTGGAAITPGFALPAKYVIHAAGPVYNPAKAHECQKQLYSAYAESLKLASKNGCKSIAFPLISSGIYGYPKGAALGTAIAAIGDFLQNHDMDVYIVFYDKSAFELAKGLSDSVENYLDEFYEPEENNRKLLQIEEKAFFREPRNMSCAESAPVLGKPPQSIDSLMQNLEAPFSDALLSIIDEKGKTDVEVYKKANIDRKLFSKIRTGKGYTPKKPTILALAVALELDIGETEELLERAGYALSHASKFDVIVEYFIVSGRYDIFEINETLFKYDLPQLGT